MAEAAGLTIIGFRIVATGRLLLGYALTEYIAEAACEHVAHEGFTEAAQIMHIAKPARDAVVGVREPIAHTLAGMIR